MKPFFTPLLPACFLFVGLGAKAIELISAQTRGNSNAVTVTFSADVTEASATNAANYSVSSLKAKCTPSRSAGCRTAPFHLVFR